MYGWCGKILRIDLSAGRFEVENPEPELYTRWIGGRGLAGHYLREVGTPSWEDPENSLLFFSPPLVNTSPPLLGRAAAFAPFSPTRGGGEASLRQDDPVPGV